MFRKIIFLMIALLGLSLIPSDNFSFTKIAMAKKPAGSFEFNFVEFRAYIEERYQFIMTAGDQNQRKERLRGLRGFMSQYLQSLQAKITEKGMVIDTSINRLVNEGIPEEDRGELPRVEEKSPVQLEADAAAKVMLNAEVVQLKFLETVVLKTHTALFPIFEKLLGEVPNEKLADTCAFTIREVEYSAKIGLAEDQAPPYHAIVAMNVVNAYCRK